MSGKPIHRYEWLDSTVHSISLQVWQMDGMKFKADNFYLGDRYDKKTPFSEGQLIRFPPAASE
jgi:hypothetical protein